MFRFFKLLFIIELVLEHYKIDLNQFFFDLKFKKLINLRLLIRLKLTIMPIKS